jgi:heme exporter protein A
MAKERKALTHKLSADNLTLIRGERCLFQGLSFALESGGLLILEGRNGCGKTSLIMAVSSGWRIGPGSRVI